MFLRCCGASRRALRVAGRFCHPWCSLRKGALLAAAQDACRAARLFANRPRRLCRVVDVRGSRLCAPRRRLQAPQLSAAHCRLPARGGARLRTQRRRRRRLVIARDWRCSSSRGCASAQRAAGQRRRWGGVLGWCCTRRAAALRAARRLLRRNLVRCARPPACACNGGVSSALRGCGAAALTRLRPCGCCARRAAALRAAQQRT